jgi:MFS family permease
VAAVVFAGRLPWLLFALVSGALVDRLDRRRVMWTVDVARCLVVAALAGTVLADRASIPVLMAGAFLLGVGETLFDNASQSFVPAVVGRDPDRLERANGRLYSAEIVSNQFAGPPAGGFLFALSRAVPFVVDAASFAVSAALISRVRTPATIASGRPRRGLAREIGEGLRWLWRHRLLRTLGLMVGAMNLGNMAGDAVLVLFAQDKLGVGSVGFGLLWLGGAVGGLLGSSVAHRVARRLGAGPVLIGCALVTGGAQLSIGFMSSAWAVGALFGVTGFSALMWNVITVSLRQSIVPEDLLGRVNSVYRLLAWGTLPVGAALGGAIASAFGLRAPFIVAGVALVLMPFACLPVVNTRAVDAARAEAPRR